MVNGFLVIVMIATITKIKMKSILASVVFPWLGTLVTVPFDHNDRSTFT